MGSCNSCYSSKYVQSNLESEDDCKVIQRTKSALKKGIVTYEKSRTDLEDNVIADENSLENSQQLPSFIQQRKITEIVVQTRVNRFMKDIEEEVRYRIKQIQLEEKEQLDMLIQQQQQQQSQSFQECKQESADFNSAHFNQSISFQNSQDFQNMQNTPSKTYLPRQYSQFAPKKDNDTVTYNSQVSQTINSQKQKTPPKEKLKPIQTIKDEEKSILASFGSQHINPRNSDSQDAQFSDHFREQVSSNTSKEHSVKSILKNSQNIQDLKRNYSIKSTHTNIKQKKVSFSVETNYYSSRTTKRNQTNLLYKA
ncbi:unnamed protein product (macronuclear) [Paramecium tetraurelia]|uniref:Uncharacterized protein n=1 Tax=Paramecium tetraurelia TaxID=5888 RepID=A0DZ77_PARTE|nr:uncharacterized protein GSPATT00003313001 [Paramecium tetraurelia]CAK88344.1 unnamed protein product [Paramecium tetraurelia]|eukprot:XP_001455741.1 hypothetical protein (macronuclear) [Paramecium tetraurelia strain d4-2]